MRCGCAILPMIASHVLLRRSGTAKVYAEFLARNPEPNAKASLKPLSRVCHERCVLLWLALPSSGSVMNKCMPLTETHGPRQAVLHNLPGASLRVAAAAPGTSAPFCAAPSLISAGLPACQRRRHAAAGAAPAGSANKPAPRQLGRRGREAGRQDHRRRGVHHRPGHLHRRQGLRQALRRRCRLQDRQQCEGGLMVPPRTVTRADL